MALPILYGNIADGLRSVGSKQLDAARVYNMSGVSRLRYIYIPEAVPFFLSGCSVSLGLAWKAGVAAEVIGLARFSLGERLYNAKLFLDTSEVFATTIIIVAVSWITEKLAMKSIESLCNKLL
jgi:NitT/TauT family transport system permease protein